MRRTLIALSLAASLAAAPPALQGDEGSHIDPDGAPAPQTDTGSHLDPDG